MTPLRPWLASATAAALTPALRDLAGLALMAARDEVQATLRAVTVGGLAGGGHAGRQGLPAPADAVAATWRRLAVSSAAAKAGKVFMENALAALDQAVANGGERGQAVKRLEPVLTALVANLATIARTMVQATANDARLAVMANL